MPQSFYTLQNIHQKNWFKSLAREQKELIQQSFILLEDADYLQKTFYDYSFIVMPAAKAYEGFVKDLLFFLNLISEKRYRGNRFRVGKALNPDIALDDPDQYEALYDDLIKLSNSEEIPKLLWDTWKECRNQVFHYFNRYEKSINLFSAKHKLQQILYAVENACLTFHYNSNIIYKLNSQIKME